MKVCWIKDVFQPDCREEFETHSGMTLSDYAPPGWHDKSGFCEVNGERVEADLFSGFTPSEDDSVYFVCTPGEGFAASLIVGLVLAAVSTGISYALRPSPPRLASRGPDREQIEPSPEFIGVQTTVGPGNVIPVILGGPIRVGGQIIEAFPNVTYEEQGDSGDGTTVIQRVSTSVPGTRTQNTIVAWGHGPLESLEQFEIDDNPIENITGVEHESALGTRDQKALSGITEAKTERSIGTLVDQAGGDVTVSTLSDVSFVEIKVLFQSGLFELSAAGQIKSRSVVCRFKWKKTGGASTQTFKDVTFTAASQAPTPFWVKMHLWNLAEVDKYDISLDRITADNVNPSIQDDFIWDKMVEARPGRRAHPGIALTRFEQIPPAQAPAPRKYTALAKGMNNVRVYTSGTAGAFQKQWTDDPGWNFLHVLTDTDIGPGKFYDYDTNVDLESFVDLHARNQGLVDDGTGNLEARNTLAIEIKRPMPFAEFRRICELAADAAFVEEGGKWRAVPNDVELPSHSFNDTRVVKGSIKRRFLSTRERPNRLTATFRNESRNFRDDSITRTLQGVLTPTDFVSAQENFFGVPRRSQVSRSLNTMLKFNSISDEALEFTTGSAGLNIKVGDIVRLATHVGKTAVANGRVHRMSFDQLRIELDREVAWSSSNTYDIAMFHTRTGESSLLPLVNVPDRTDNWCEVASAFWSSEPLPGDIYSVALTGESWELWRVEDTELDEQYRRRVFATKYDDDIFTLNTLIDAPQPVDESQNPTLFPGPVLDLSAVARRPQNSMGDEVNAIDVDWSPPSTGGTAAQFEVSFRESGTQAWRFAAVTGVTGVTLSSNLEDLTAYEVGVVGVSPSGNKQSLDNATTVTVTTLS